MLDWTQLKPQTVVAPPPRWPVKRGGSRIRRREACRPPAPSSTSRPCTAAPGRLPRGRWCGWSSLAPPARDAQPAQLAHSGTCEGRRRDEATERTWVKESAGEQNGGAWEVADGLRPITQAEVMSRWRRDKNQREERVKSDKNACGLRQRAARPTKDAFPFTSQLPLIHPAATTN